MVLMEKSKSDFISTVVGRGTKGKEKISIY